MAVCFQWQMAMALQAFLDESFDHKRGVFVLGGYVAPTEVWEKFTKEWLELLSYARLRDAHGNWFFKMSELVKSNEGIERSQAFFRVIERHNLVAVSVKITQPELNAALSKIFLPSANVNFGVFHNPYFVAFRILMDQFHKEWTQEILDTIWPTVGPVDFIFDEKSEKTVIFNGWDEYLALRDPSIRKLFGAKPQFRDEKKCVPLQAADFWVWWRRRWYEEGKGVFEFGEWKKNKDIVMYLMDVEHNERDLTVDFVKAVRVNLGPFVTILDRTSRMPIVDGTTGKPI